MIPSTITKKDVRQQKIISCCFTQPNTSAGFTLVELMVSLTIFSIVMLISIGTLLIMVDVNAKAQALYTATTNLSFALDNMTRELRMGYNYVCRPNPLNNLPNVNTRRDCNCEEIDDQAEKQQCRELALPQDDDYSYEFISFVRERDGFRVGYKLQNGVIMQKVDGPGNANDVDWTAVTSPDVTIDTFKLFVDHAAESYITNDDHDTGQPYVDILIKGHVNNGLETDTDFNIQSRVIQRRLDLI